MKNIFYRVLLSVVLATIVFDCTTPKEKDIHVKTWITNSDQSSLLQLDSTLLFRIQDSVGPVIQIDSAIRYQSMDGFGYSLTGGSAQLINQNLNESDRQALLRELFSSDNDGIGISYLRISIGASDLDDHVFSYDDLATGETDPTLSKFSLAPDRENLIPILKEIKKISPSIKIMASPWSAPVWMKSNQSPKGGSLKREYYDVYADYLLKYIESMQQEGIQVDAITTQNEPEHPGNTPSMTMTWMEQNEFIKHHLGPTFVKHGIETKIILFDHNCDHPDYPISILNDSITRKFVDGTAFHMYLGEITALSKVHDAHPDKNLYFTEQWTSGNGDFGGDLRWHVKNLIIGAPRNWSRNVLEWNLASDENWNPHTDDGGCNLCRGALIIDSKTGAVSRNVSYYIIAHASKFVMPGSFRIESNEPDHLSNVAFTTPEGKKVLIVINDGDQERKFSIKFNGRIAHASLMAGAVATYVW